jgi:hypothetical protein
MAAFDTSKRGVRIEQIAGAAIAALGGYIAWAAREYPFGTLAEPGPGYLPFVLALIFAGFGVVVALRAGIVAIERKVSFADFPHAVLLLVVLAAAAASIERLGYRVTVAAMLLFLLAVVERRNPIVSVLLAAVMSLGSFYLINNVLRVPLPLGPWGL